ncbi:MAG: LamG-like jellyroll fold domain-containing protein [Acidimicrobiales bacterium]
MQPQSAVTESADSSSRLEGLWTFEEGGGDTARDSSGNGQTLSAHGDPVWVGGGTFGGAIALDGASQWLTTAGPILRTTESYSVAAWVRFDTGTMDPGLRLPRGTYAVTAVSQIGPSSEEPTHSPFYLGARAIKQTMPDGTSPAALRWCLTVAPVDGSMTGVLEWQHATSAKPIEVSVFDEWVLLVGVCDTATRTTQLYVPGTDDGGTATLPEEWPFWQAEGGLQVGQAFWLGNPVDRWPGSVGPVRAYSGVLTADDAVSLYEQGATAER